jgi:DNA gyrase/topoisomerase IV subunit A
VSKEGDVFLVSSAGIGIRTPIGKISRQKRDTTGVRVIDVGEGNELSAIATVHDVEE